MYGTERTGTEETNCIGSSCEQPTNREGRHWQDFLPIKKGGREIRRGHRLSYLPLKEEREGQDWSFFD
jgi:hypothetical protein